MTKKKVPSTGGRVREVKAWADVGSHGHIFAFEGGGQCATNYRGMMHIYTSQVTPGLIPVSISYSLPSPKRGGGKK